MRRPWLLVAVAWVVPATLAALQAVAQHQLGNWEGDLTLSLLFQFTDWLLYAALTPIVFWLARRFPLSRDRLWRHLVLHLLAALGNCALWAAGGSVLRWLVFDDPGALTAHGFFGWFFTSLPFGVAVYFAVLGIEHAIYYFGQARDRETQAARLSAQLAEARLGALRMQLRPHFLLNSLNAVLVLVRDRDHVTAARVLEELGEMLRHVLRTGRPALVPLDEELEFLRRYLAIEQVRFADRLAIEVAVEPSLGAALVPEFVLQPLVENAVRHGIAARVEGGRIRIAGRREGEDLVLEVEDDGSGFDPALPTEGVGLTNTRERLAVLYGERGSLAVGPRWGGGTVATVRLPYRTEAAG